MSRAAAQVSLLPALQLAIPLADKEQPKHNLLKFPEEKRNYPELEPQQKRDPTALITREQRRSPSPARPCPRSSNGRAASPALSVSGWGGRTRAG